MVRHSVKGFLVSIFVVATFFLYGVSAQAAGLNVLIYTHTNDPNVKNAYINSYRAFQNIPGTTVIQRDITGMSFEQYQAQLRADMSSGQNLLIYGGHGSLTDQSTDGVSFSRNYAMRAASNIAAEKGGQVTGVVESCGSGNVVCYGGDLAGSGNLDGVFTASLPGDYGYVFSQGGPWYAKFGEQFKSSLSHFGDGTNLDPDVNKDGVLTHGELANAVYGKDAAKRAQMKDPNAPFAFKDAETEAKYAKYTECVIARPGQVDNTYSPGNSSSGDVAIEYKPSSISGYENRTNDAAAFPVLGQVRDEQSDESQLNFDLRRLGSDFIEKEIQKIINGQSSSKGVTKRIIILPTKEQADEFVKSLGNNANAQGSYSVNGMKVDAGKRYLANKPDPEKKITFDNECNPREWSPSSNPPASNPGVNNPGANNGGNQGGNNGGGSPQEEQTGLNSLLPLLLQSLLGQQNGLNNQQNQPNNSINSPTSCSAYGVSPVCGSDGTKTTTYTNSCWEQQLGAIQVSTGVCLTSIPTPTPQSTPDITKIVTQLIASGAPQTVISNIINSIASLFAHPKGETVIQ